MSKIPLIFFVNLKLLKLNRDLYKVIQITTNDLNEHNFDSLSTTSLNFCCNESATKETVKRVPTPAPTTPEPTPSPTYPPHGNFQRIKIKHESIEKYRIVHGSVAREPTAMPVAVPHDTMTKMPTPMPTISSVSHIFIPNNFGILIFTLLETCINFKN